MLKQLNLVYLFIDSQMTLPRMCKARPFGLHFNSMIWLASFLLWPSFCLIWELLSVADTVVLLTVLIYIVCFEGSWVYRPGKMLTFCKLKTYVSHFRFYLKVCIWVGTLPVLPEGALWEFSVFVRNQLGRPLIWVSFI